MLAALYCPLSKKDWPLRTYFAARTCGSRLQAENSSNTAIAAATTDLVLVTKLLSNLGRIASLEGPRLEHELHLCSSLYCGGRRLSKDISMLQRSIQGAEA